MDLHRAYFVSVFAWAAWALYWLVAAQFVHSAKSSEGALMRTTHLLPLAVGFLLIFHDSDHSLIYGRLHRSVAVAMLGNAITVAGLLFSVWSRIHLGKYWSGIITLKEGHKLITTGPYRFVRHPLYTGFLSAILGSALTVLTGDGFVGLVVVVAAFLVKMRREETVLTGEFGDEYRHYKQGVWALVPLIY